MELVTYTPDCFPRLAAAAAAAPGARSLRHRAFVDYYYTTRESCRLHLLVDETGDVAAALGLEKIPFEYEGAALELGVGSNFVAFRKGAGGLLFLLWVRASDVACSYGGSEDTHRILRHQRWTYFPGVKVYKLNGRWLPVPSDAPWRRAAKAVARAVAPGIDLRRLAERARRDPAYAGLHVTEVSAVTAELLPARGPFRFRMRPSAEYLAWRYRRDLPFARYRAFRIDRDATPCGYVIVNEQRARWLVAQADATDVDALAGGIVLALGALADADVAHQEVLLACAHRGLGTRLERLGFVPGRTERAFALTAHRRPLDWPIDTSEWLVNFDWTDNGLRPPFLDEATVPRLAPEAASLAPSVP